MADNKTIILKLELEQSAVKVRIKNLKKEIKELDGRTLEYKNKVKQLEVAESKLVNVNNNLAASYKNLNTKLDGSTAATGGATSAALELGRVVSDMPYGIRGVANNLSQFASNMVFAAKSTDAATGKVVGLTGAIKGLWAALKGPLGILLAIQAVIAALDHFSQKTSDAGVNLDDLTADSITNSVAELTALKRLLNDSTVALEDKERALANAADEYEDLNTAIKDGNLSMTQTISVLDVLINKYKDLARAKALMELMTEAMKEQAKLASGAGFTNIFDSFSSFFSAAGAAFSGRDPLSAAWTNSVSSANEAMKDIENLLMQPTTADSSLTYLDLLFGSDKKGKKGKRDRAFLLGLNAIDPKDIEKWAKKTLKIVNNALGNPSVGVLDGLSAEIPQHWKDRISEYLLELDKQTTEKLRKQYLQEDIKAVTEIFKTAYSGINDFLSSEFDRQMTIEQNKTNALNEELNNRLLNEELSKEERKKIQNQIWQNDEALRKRQEKIERKKFNQQKAFNIAMATVDTYRAANGVLADTKGGSFARIAGMIAVISTGLLNVASIARQKFQSSSASTPINVGSGGGSSGDGNSRSFNFNLVGGERENQLLGAIQSQFNNPLKAYVVSRDVTNQQQLDSDIQGTAGF